MTASAWLAVGSLAQTNSLQDFVDSVNTAWQQTNTTQVLSLVNQRLSENSNDVCALCLKAYYHVLVDGVLTNGQVSADRFNALVQQGTNTNARAVSQQMKDQVFAVPTNEAAPLTAEQINQIHDSLPTSFPMIEKCKWLATKTGGTSP
jgi:uncharacterized protein (DUF2267 family)